MLKPNSFLYILTLITLILTTETANSQTYQPSNRTPVADTTLGTQVSATGNNFDITGGLTKGQTTFHSFTDFSIPTNGQANFLNSARTRDIITRVTGGFFSDINGTLNSNGANFFLINPNGIIFGNNATLNVGKAFVASTANSLNLVDGSGRAITVGANANGDAPLLSIAPNVLFNVSSLTFAGGNGQISSSGTWLSKTPAYIGLIGGNVRLDGGIILNLGGRVELGGLSAPGTVTFGVDGNSLRAQFPANVERGNVSLSKSALAVIEAGNGGAGGGDISITGKNVDMQGGLLFGGDISIDAAGAISLTNGASISAPTYGQGDAGNIKITAKDAISLVDASIASKVLTGAVGNGGNINITAAALSLKNSGIEASTSGRGNAGDITVKTTGAIEMTGQTKFTGILSTVEPGGIGNGGNIDVTAGSLTLRDGAPLGAVTRAASDTQPAAQGNAGNVTVNVTGAIDISVRKVGSSAVSGMFSYTEGSGNGGNVTVNTGSLSMRDGAQLTASTYERGDAGNVKVTAKDGVSLADADILSVVAEGAVGKGGNIEIIASDLTLRDGSRIIASTSGKGNAGNITIKVSGAISSDGIKNGFASRILSTVEAGGVGNGGNIDVTAGSLSLLDGAPLGAVTRAASATQPAAKGDAGNVTVNVTGAIDIAGRTVGSSAVSGMFSYVGEGAEGNGGNVTVNTGSLSIRDGAKLSASAFGQGNAGNVEVTAKDTISLVNAEIVAKVGTTGVGRGGNIKIKASSLSLRNGSLLNASTFGKGNAGDIDIQTTGDISIVGNSNSSYSQIASNTYGEGNAGNITIDTQNKGTLSLSKGGISIGISEGQGNGGKISISTRELNLKNRSAIFSANVGGKGSTGDIDIKTVGAIELSNFSTISSTNFSEGGTGNIFLNSDQFILNNSFILATSNGATGGNIDLTTRDKLLLRNFSRISTTSDSVGRNGNGGNINVNSPLIIALPGNNDISANAYAGNGGKVNITSQGLFGIKFRPVGSDLTSDITASSTFGQSGNVSISTPGTDPGKDSNQLPTVPNDASNQISQVCSASTRNNKLIVTGRGGLPPNANDTLTGDVVWQDARAVSSQPVASNAITNPTQLVPPAVGWVIDGKGKVTLIAAGAEAKPTGTSVVCPNVGK